MPQPVWENSLRLLLQSQRKNSVTNLRKRTARIMGAPEGVDPFYGAPVILVVLANKAIPTHVYDGSLVMGNLMNAAESLGVANIWITELKRSSSLILARTSLQTLALKENTKESVTVHSAMQ